MSDNVADSRGAQASGPRRVLVTGATGFVGRSLVPLLADRGHEVVAWHRASSRTDWLPRDRVQLAQGEITDVSALRRAMDGVDVVVHLAAHLGHKRRARDAQWRVNVDGTAAVLAAAGERQVVHMSSVMAIGHPQAGEPPATEETPFNWPRRFGYAHSKAAAEALAMRAGAIIVNPATIVGPTWDGRPSQRVLHYLRLARKVGCPVGTDTVVDVNDVARGTFDALEHGQRGRRYVLGGDCVSFRAFLDEAARLLGVPPIRHNLRAPVARVLAFGLDAVDRFAFGLGPSGTGAVLSSMDRRYSSERARRELGYHWLDHRDLLRRALCLDASRGGTR